MFVLKMTSKELGEHVCIVVEVVDRSQNNIWAGSGVECQRQIMVDARAELVVVLAAPYILVREQSINFQIGEVEY